jgi:hypothetical protein
VTSGFWNTGTPLDLDAMRFVVDPPADQVVDAVYASHQDAGVAALLDSLGRSSTSVEHQPAGAGDARAGLQLRLGRHHLNLHWAHRADEAAAAAVGSGIVSDSFSDRLRARLLAEHPGVVALPPWAETLCDYFATTARLPEWADPEKLERGSRLAVLYGILDSLILCCASLPWCYLDAKGVPVLASTQRLQGARVYRRIWETSHFVVNAVAPGGLAPNGKGTYFAQRVRLLHAAVRNRLLRPRPPQGWPVDAGRTAVSMGESVDKVDWNTIGLPLNQEDLAYVLLTFSYVGVSGLRKLGARPTREDADAYIHLWNVVGHVLGIRQELMAETFDDAEALFHVLLDRVREESEKGHLLTQSLVTWMEEVAPGRTKDVPTILLTHLLGRENAAMLGVERTTRQKLRAPFTLAAIRTTTRLIELARRETGTAVSLALRKALFTVAVGGLWERRRSQWDDLARWPDAYTGNEDAAPAAAH